jgi:ABC-type glycerol-3-phosphate transport system permease component
MSRRWTPSLALIHLVLALGVLISVGPLAWVALSSFKQVSDIFRYPPQLIPSPGTLDSYRTLFGEIPFSRWFVNSVVTSVVATAAAVFFSALAGYAFAKYRFRGRRFLFDVMFSSLMVPFAVVLVPLFIEITRLGWADSYLALVVPWIAPAFGIFLMRQFIIQTVPDEIIDAARVDGAGEFQIFWRIVVPVVRPALGALAVWNFLNAYNSFLWPLTVISNQDMLTLPLGLNALNGNYSREYGTVLAAALLAALPTIGLFLTLRRQLISGLTVGSVKG